VYSLENPRSLRRSPYRPSAQPIVSLMQAEARAPSCKAPLPPATMVAARRHRFPASNLPTFSTGVSIYRLGNRIPAIRAAQPAESSAARPSVTVRALLDSATLSLPDTNEFTFRPYKVRFTADLRRATDRRYQRDNFGRRACSVDGDRALDILGNHSWWWLAGSITDASARPSSSVSTSPVASPETGRAASHRIRSTSTGGSDQTRIADPNRPGDSLDVLLDAHSGASSFATCLPNLVSVQHGSTASSWACTPSTSRRPHWTCRPPTTRARATSTTKAARPGWRPSATFVQPSIAHVHDNTLFGYVGPFAGARSPVFIAPAFGKLAVYGRAWSITGGISSSGRSPSPSAG